MAKVEAAAAAVAAAAASVILGVEEGMAVPMATAGGITETSGIMLAMAVVVMAAGPSRGVS